MGQARICTLHGEFWAPFTIEVALRGRSLRLPFPPLPLDAQSHRSCRDQTKGDGKGGTLKIGHGTNDKTKPCRAIAGYGRMKI